ncbi:MAG: serine hydrolase, partial [Rikenellaceae bacterium]|nr:serine hydrolase [Rikenellaceae bacterium]
MKLIRLLPVFLLLSNISMSQISKEDHIECFLDGVLETQLLEKHIAGAALALVKDDEIVVTKGYGYSDYYQRIPVDPTQTMFRIGSVSKLFVWFAVMQMVEQGKIDLDADVNTYLKDFKIPEAFDGPITMRHIMSHTPGFEDKIIKLFSDDSLSVLPLSKLLPTQIPKRVRPAGVQASYSNHAVAIAAHIVELVSGMEWNDYVEQNIFNPLKMYTTTFRQPLPGYLKANMSKGYTYENEVITE